MTTERVVEVPWVLGKVAGARRILDVGACDSAYLAQLAATGAEVWANDTRDFEAPAGVRKLIGSAGCIDMPGHFDLVTCVSVLDHVGLEAYGNAARPGELLTVALRLRDLLAPGGRLVLTVPFGRPQVTTHPGGAQRVFGLRLLAELFPDYDWHELDLQLWRRVGEAYELARLTEVIDAEYGGFRAEAVLGWELLLK